MKKLFLGLMMLAGTTFGFAKSEIKTIEITNSKTEKIDAKVVDAKTFSEMLENNDLRIVKIIELDESFLFLDDCGNWWIVEYDSSFYTPFSAFLKASKLISELTGC